MISFNYIESLPSGDLVALMDAGTGIARVPTVIHRDGSPDTVLDVDIPTETYDNSFRTDKVFIDANGKTVVASSYQERLTLPSWPFYEYKYRAVLDIFMPDGRHQQRWNSVSLGRNKTFSPRDEQYRLTNGAIYTINNDEYPYSPTTPKLEKIVIPDISLGYREAVHWGVDGVDLAKFDLKYLALGDSISSGEGDTAINPATGSKYYRAFTDVEENSLQGQPREKCHISTRSYPYLLAGSMNLRHYAGSQAGWESVACSGATKTDLYAFGYGYDGLNLYSGQPKGSSKAGSLNASIPRLEGYTNKNTLQAIALNENIPGRIEQIQFVEKYKPSVITLTAGANDIDFAGKLQSCVLHSETCEWATSKKSTLAQQIKNQYDGLVSLYQKLYEASGNKAKIYAVGYPRLVSAASPGSCGSNTINLDLTEREMMVNATDYLNRVIESAAITAGVKYLDISDSLSSGKLCEGVQSYVNGVAMLGGSELQESFHPNSDGQAKIVKAIEYDLGYQSMLSYDNCPNTNDAICSGTIDPSDLDIPSELGEDTGTKSQNVTVTKNVIEKSDPVTVTLPEPLFKGNTTFNATLHSNPIDLGDYTTDNNGNISNTITIPSTAPTGYHTLILSGEDPNGDPIEITQTVLVVGSDPDDLDDDNTPDVQQACGPFIMPSGIDADLDGIDDACDSEISTSPQLYRLRLGDTTRSYNGNAEHENYLYIERNTRASSITGITGDYDPDSDGWAIVGTSQGTIYSSLSVPDTAPAANFIVTGSGTGAVPNVYIRAGDYGCVGFSPTSLAQVQANQNRTFSKVSYNTDKCRQEDLSIDADMDGMADDDDDSLYTARQGDGFIGEDPTRVYLFRNFYSAEAQLGTSDYTPTGTPAGDTSKPIQSLNLLATNNPSDDLILFNKLVILEDSNGKPLPIVLVKDGLNQCIAYQLNDTTIIKQSTQSTRYLTKLTSLPTGVNCE